MKANAPDWCASTNEWCYVDPDYCQDSSGNYMMSSLSSYFPGAGLSYSYGTCGGARNTFDSWVDAGMPANTCSQAQALGMISTLEQYVKTTATAVESAQTAHSYEPMTTCNGHASCPSCTTCDSASGVRCTTLLAALPPSADSDRCVCWP